MNLERDIQEFTSSNSDIEYKLFKLKNSIQSLDVGNKHKKDAVNALEELNTYVQGLKYDVREGSYLERNNYFGIYDYIITHLYKLESAKKHFGEFNEKLERKYVSQLLKLLNHLDKDPENPEETAVSILSGRHDKSAYFVNLGVKKGFLDSDFKEYNPWEAEEKFEEIISYDEKLGYEIALKCRKKAFQYGKNALDDRPVLYLDEKALKNANKYYKNKTVGEDGVESGALFHYRRLGGRKILLDEFEGLNTIDKRKNTGTKHHQELRFRGESGRNIIFCHSHPNQGYIADRLSGGDLDILTNPANGTLGAGLREGITLLALPVPDNSPPNEDIVWLACAVNSEGYAGNFYLHVVQKGEGDNFTKIDGKYSWVNIHNKWIKPSYASKNEGPYSYYQKEKKLEKIREQIF